MSRRAWVLLGVGVAVVALAVAFAWPPADPLAGARTVALRAGADAGAADVEVAAELEVVLGARNLKIVTDERTADVVLAVTAARFDVGNVQLALSGGKFTGRATAVCRIQNVRTGRSYVMDFIMTLRDGEVHARLVGRRFWEFWKPSPGI